MKRILGLLFALVVTGAFLAFGISQEVPIGRVTGVVTMNENGKPIKNALVTLTPIEEVNLAQPSRHFAKTDESGSFNITNLTAGVYRLEGSAKEHHFDALAVTVVEGKPTNLEVHMVPSDRYLRMYTSQHVFTPDEKPVVEVHGFVQQDKLHVTVRQLSLAAIAKRGGFDATLSLLARPELSESEVNPNSISTLLADSTIEVKDKDPEGAFIESLPLPDLKEGFYWVSCKAGEQHTAAFVNISRIALVTKSDGNKALNYVVDIASGKPISGASILCSKAGQLASQAQTGSDGCVTVDLTGPDDNVIAAKWEGSVALCSTFSRSEPEPADEEGADESGGASAKREGKVFTYTDRPVYRPGDLVRFKSIVRILSGYEYKLPATGPARVELRDSDQNLIESQHLTISSHGTVHGQFLTSKEAKPGAYALIVHAAGLQDTYYVNLAAYHKPDVKVTTHVEKPHYVAGERPKVSISCEYYFGGPVVGAKVSGFVYRAPDWGAMYASEEESDDTGDEMTDEEPFYRGNQGDQGGEYSVEIHAVTDSAGRATIQFPTSLAEGQDAYASDFIYSVNFNVADGSDRSASGVEQVAVSRASYNLSVSTDPMIASKGDVVNISLATRNYDTAHSPVAGRPISVEVTEERWTRRTYVLLPVAKLEAITDQKGNAVVHFPIGLEGSLRIKASSEDEQGRKVEAESYIYVEGSAMVRGPKEPRFKLTLDKKTYATGDRAKALIQTDQPGGVALVSLQAEHLIYSETVPLTSGSTVVHLALPKTASPNSYFSVCYVRKKSFNEATRQVVVKRSDRKLTVTVSPDRPTAQPGQTVSFKVHTQDDKGKPVPSEVSVGVVDESVYAIAEDTTDIVRSMFPHRPNLVETEFSFPEVFLDGGDKAGASVPIRTHFEDTASWNPEVETNSKGDGLVTLKLPDNLTTWRATAIAVSDQSQVGMSTGDVRSSKPLMVRIQSPAFMVKTDRQSVSVAITNDTGSDQNVHFRIDASGLKIDKAPPADVKLTSGETQSIPVEASAPLSGPAVLTARVWTDSGDEDGVESRFTIEPHGRLVLDNQSGAVASDAKFEVERFADTDPSAGRLAITITPGVLAGMYQSLDGLVQFPYGCVEQTMSRFLPAVVVTHTLREVGTPEPSLEKRVPAITVDGFSRLAAMQHEDGGWGWWTFDESDAFMTAWVLDGLDRLKKLGVTIPPTINVDKALDWATTHLGSKLKESVDSKLYLMDSLAKYGKFEEDSTGRLIWNTCLEKYPYEDPLRRWCLAALAANTAGEKQSLDVLIQHIDAEVDANRNYYREYDCYEDENTALSLLALVTLNPTDPRVHPLALKLCMHRGVDGWQSTRATTFAVEGLTAYMKFANERTGPSDLEVDLNGSPIKKIHLDPVTIDSTDLHIEIPVEGLQVGKNEISIHRQGPGSSFYSSELRQYRDQAVLGQQMVSDEITVERHYYLLKPQALEDGSLKLMKTKAPVDEAKAGDLIQCVLTIQSPRDREYVFIEDPIPSNCRVTEREDGNDNNEWDFWWCNITIFDDRVGLFSRFFPKGTSTVVYTMRAEDSGLSHALPTRVSNMYDPSQAGQSAETSMEVSQ